MNFSNTLIEDDILLLSHVQRKLDNMCNSLIYHPTRDIITNARFWVVSNRMDIIEFEEESRRFAVFEPASILKGNQFFFQKWRKRYWVDFVNRKANLRYLLEHKIPEDWHPENSYPKTSIKRQLQETNLSPIAIFLYSLAATLLRQKPNARFYDASASQLKTKFGLWCDITFRGENKKVQIPSRKSFPTALRELSIFNSRDEEAPCKKSYNDGVYYQFPLTEQKATLYSLEDLAKELSIEVHNSHFHV